MERRDVEAYAGLVSLENMIRDALANTELAWLDEEQIKQKMRPVSIAYQIAKMKHDWQVRKSGEPYFHAHVKEVAKISLIELPNPTIKRVLVGLLHDILEDTDITLQTIENLFGKNIAHDVDLLTKQDYEYYFGEEDKAKRESYTPTRQKELLNDPEFQKKIANNRSQKYFATMVQEWSEDVIRDKIADRLHNLRSSTDLSQEKIQKSIEETEKYFLPLLEKNPIFALGVTLMKEDIRKLKRYVKNEQTKEEIAESFDRILYQIHEK